MMMIDDDDADDGGTRATQFNCRPADAEANADGDADAEGTWARLDRARRQETGNRKRRTMIAITTA